MKSNRDYINFIQRIFDYFYINRKYKLTATEIGKDLHLSSKQVPGLVKGVQRYVPIVIINEKPRLYTLKEGLEYRKFSSPKRHFDTFLRLQKTS